MNFEIKDGKIIKIRTIIDKSTVDEMILKENGRIATLTISRGGDRKPFDIVVIGEDLSKAASNWVCCSGLLRYIQLGGVING